jgi:3-hydroxyacyl-CoA dehydrogenase
LFDLDERFEMNTIAKGRLGDKNGRGFYEHPKQ